MRVLVDSSVWSLGLRRGGPEDHPKVRRLAALLSAEEELFLTGTILQEILQAFRSDLQLRKMDAYLESFPLLSLGRSGYRDAAGISRRCARRGFGVSTTDCQIAAAAIRHHCHLLTADEDFERIAEVSTLEVV